MVVSRFCVCKRLRKTTSRNSYNLSSVIWVSAERYASQLYRLMFVFVTQSYKKKKKHVIRFRYITCTFGFIQQFGLVELFSSFSLDKTFYVSVGVVISLWYTTIDSITASKSLPGAEPQLWVYPLTTPLPLVF